MSFYADILAMAAGPTGRATVTPELSFLKQWDFVASPSRFSVVVCSRRAGKTDGAIRKAAKLMLERPGSRVLYVQPVRREAKLQFFQPFEAFLASIGAEIAEKDSTLLTLTLANGSFLQAWGCKDVGDENSLRGYKWDLVIIDEAQNFRDVVIAPLIDAVVLPSLVDRRGSLVFAGTPSPQGPVGYFYDVFSSSRFQRFHWTWFDNPFIDPEAIKEIQDVRGLTVDHPTYRREFLGEFVVDVESLVYEYQDIRNARRKPDDLAASPEWRYSMGVDLGFSDRDAIVVLGWRRDDPTHALIEVESWQQNHLDVDQLAEKFTEVYKRWRPTAIVGDTGGHGAVKVLKSLQSRIGSGAAAIQPKPASLLDSIALVNDDLRTGRLRVDASGPIAHDAKLTTWKVGKIKQEVSDSYHSDILDALRYAHWGARHWTGKAAKPAKSYTELREERLVAAERAERDPFGMIRRRR